jgi:FkbM family methyltransferase
MRYVNLLKNVSNWWVHFFVKFGLSDSNPIVFKGRNNVVFEVPRIVQHVFKEIFMEHSYMIGLRNVIPDCPVVIDIGANVGFFTMFIASRFPNATVFAYEPIRNNYAQLKRNAELNKHVRISCFEKAVFSHTGEVPICFDPHDSLTTTAHIIQESEESKSCIRVPCVSLVDIFENNNIEHCDLLKMDCEGAEFDIILNCPQEYLTRIDQVAMELHANGSDIETLKAFLTKSDFRIHQIRGKEHMLWAWR